MLCDGVISIDIFNKGDVFRSITSSKFKDLIQHSSDFSCFVDKKELEVKDHLDN